MADPPQVGEIVDGYRFKGGDRYDQKNWEQTTPGDTPASGGVMPNVGDVVDGYAFKGGDRYDKKNWSKVYAPGEALESMVRPTTLIKSVGNRLGEYAEAITHPLTTLTQIGNLGTQLQPNNIVNYAGLKLKAMMSSGEEAKKLDAQATQLMSAVEPILKDKIETYGSAENFWRMIAEDPTILLSDLSNFAMPIKGGVTSGLTKAGVKAGKAAKLGGIAGEVVQNFDMPTAILNASRLAIDKGGKLATDIGGVRTGVGGAAIREAAEAAAKGGDHFDDFRRGMSGALGEDEMVNRARTGLRNMRDKMQSDYVAQHGQLGAGYIPAFGEIDQSLRKADDSLYKTYPSGQRDSVLNKADQKTWQNVLDTVERWRNDPSRHTVVGLDDLKQSVRNQLAWTDKNRNLQRAVTEVTDGILDSVKKHAPPEYIPMLKEYSEAAKLTEQIEKEFALGRNRTPQQSMTKLQSILRNNVNTRFGERVRLADILEDQGGVRLKSGIAGLTFNTSEPRGIARVGGGALGAGIGGALASSLGPLGIGLGAAAGMGAEALLNSPRMWGGAAQGVGMTRRALDARARIGGVNMPSAREVITAPFKPGVVNLERMLGREQQQEEEGRARGGRIGYAKGGTVRRRRYDEGGEVLEDPMLAAISGGNPAVQRLRSNFFTPMVTPGKIGASRAVKAEAPQVALPKLSEGKASNEIGDAIGQGVGLVNKHFEAERKADEERERQEILDRIKATGAGASGATASLGAAGTGGPGTVAYDQTFGLPDPQPLPGSYEERVRAAESGGKDTAANPSGASGRYQFMPATAEGLRKQFPDLKISDNWRTNAEDQEKLMKAYTDISRQALAKMGLDPTGGHLYMMHLFGQGGGQRVLSQLDKPIKEITTEAERAANPFLNQFLTGKDLLNYFNKRFG